MSGTTNPFSDYIAQTEVQYGIPGGLLNNLLGVETGFTYDPNSYNASSGATGIAQVLPTTANNPGYGASPLTNPYDPYASINFAGQYLSGLYQSFGSWVQAVQQYGTTSTPGTSTMTGAQTDLFNMASALDTGEMMNGGPVMPGSPAAHVGGAVSGAYNTVTGFPGQVVGAATSWLNAAGLRILIAIIAIVFIGSGLFMLGGKEIIQNVNKLPAAE